MQERRKSVRSFRASLEPEPKARTQSYVVPNLELHQLLKLQCLGLDLWWEFRVLVCNLYDTCVLRLTHVRARP